MTTLIQARPASPLLRRIICSHCWESFTPDQVLFVSEHQELLGDPNLGPKQQRRFPPTRFNLAGDAIDARGMTCRTLACPKCHLAIPRGALEMETFFLSILGSAKSGKTYFLAAMMSQLRKVLPFEFSVNLTDVDLETNRTLNLNEEKLLHHPEADQFQPLSELIEKTFEESGDLYDEIQFGPERVRLVRPFLFALYPKAEHPNHEKAAVLRRLLCLYDNAGEHFEPGRDQKRTPVTRHLAQSRALLFVFDPTQDKEFRNALREYRIDMKKGGGTKLSRQDVILNEAAARVRRHAGLGPSEKHDRPLIVVVTKSDQWTALFPPDDPAPPWLRGKDPKVPAGLDVDRVEKRSDELRRVLVKYCPEVVAAAEGFTSVVRYVAVSALGPHVEVDPNTGVVGIRPERIKPDWVTVPFLYALTLVLPGLIPRIKRKPGKP